MTTDPVIDYMDVFRQAEAFYAAAVVLGHKYLAEIEEKEGISGEFVQEAHRLAPAVAANAILSCELCMKTVLAFRGTKIEPIHNLALLFKDLDDHDKHEFESMYVMHLINAGKADFETLRVAETVFRSHLREVKTLFTEARYPYSIPIKFEVFHKELVNSMRDAAIGICGIDPGLAMVSWEPVHKPTED